MASSQAELKPGDLIEIFRPGYTHWALYVGDGYVVHLAPPSEIAGAGAASLRSVLTDKAIVKKELLSEVAGNDKYRVNNKYDQKHKPLDPSEIVRRAEQLVGQEMVYKLTISNCEHFVTKLRYGVSCCDQVKEAVLAVGLVAVGAFISPAFGIPAGVAAGIFGTAMAIKGFIGYLKN